jgi:hypothetical protein
MKNPIFITLVWITLWCPAAFGSDLFTHWTAVNTSDDTASGWLGASFVSLTTDVSAGSLGSPVRGGITNGTFTGYDTNFFTPSVSRTDVINLEAASSFTLTFQPPASNPTLHLYQLADNTLSFSDGVNPIELKLLSSDGTFTMPDGSTGSSLTGVKSQTDSSGSIQFTGTFSRISWHSNARRLDDGLGLQISLPLLVLSIQTTNNLDVVISWPRTSGNFVLQQNTDLNTTNWIAAVFTITTNAVSNDITVPAPSGNLFFRLKSL